MLTEPSSRNGVAIAVRTSPNTDLAYPSGSGAPESFLPLASGHPGPPPTANSIQTTVAGVCRLRAKTVPIGGQTNRSPRNSEERFEPDREARRQRANLVQREQHARHERLAVERVVPDRQQLAVATEEHLLVRDEPRQSHGMNRRCAAQQRRGRARRARRCVDLRLV